MTHVNDKAISGGRAAKQQKKSRSWRQRLANVAAKTALLGSLLFGAAWCGNVEAAITPTFTANYNANERAAVNRVLAYWNEILPSANKVIDFDKNSSDMEADTLAHASGNHVSINANKGWTSDANSQVLASSVGSRNPSNLVINSLEQVLIHELGHIFGINANTANNLKDGQIIVTYTRDGHHYIGNSWPATWNPFEPSEEDRRRLLYWTDLTEWDKNIKYKGESVHPWVHHKLEILPDIYLYNYYEIWPHTGWDIGEFKFYGTESIRVLNDGNPSGLERVEVENGRNTSQDNDNLGSLFTHPYTLHGIMNSTGNQNGGTSINGRPFFSEVELAMLIDVGNASVVLLDHFGRSIYQSGAGKNNPTRITNAVDWSSDKMYAVGLHLVGSNNVINNTADLSSSGYAGAGIRIEGDNNKVTIAKNTTVSANGTNGIGVLSIWGTGTVLVNKGTIEAKGTNGYGVWFQEAITDGNFTNSGTIDAGVGGNYAIWSESKDAKPVVNFVDGAKVIGKIGGAKSTKLALTFGKSVDADGNAIASGDNNFSLVHSYDIVGDGDIDIETWGGTTRLTAATLKFNNGFIGQDTSATPVASILQLPGEVTFNDLTVGSASNRVSILDGMTTGSIEVDKDVVNWGTVKNVALFDTAQDLINRNTMIDNGSINATDDIRNYGVINRSTYVIADSEITNGNGADAATISDVWQLKAGAAIINNDGGVIQDVAIMEAHTNLRNSGVIERVGEIWVTRDATNNATGKIDIAKAEEMRVGRNVDNAGLMKVNGNVDVTLAFNNNATGLVEGTGKISALGGTTNRGVISPGNSIGILTFAGPFANVGGTFAIEVDPSHYPVQPPVAGTHNDLVRVVETALNAADGTATVNGGNVVVAAPSNDKSVNPTPARYVANTKYTFLTAQNGLTVTTALDEEAIETTPIALFDFVTGHDGANNYWLDVQREYIYGPFGDTFNQRGVGTYIDDVGSDPNPLGDFFGVLVALDKLNSDAGIAKRKGISAAAKFAEDQMSGANYASLATSSIMNTTIVNNTLGDVLRRDSFGQSVANCEPCDPCETAVCTPKALPKRTAWGLGYGTGGSVRHDGNAYGYDQTFGGTIVGIDRRYERTTRLGAYLSYGEGRVSSDLRDRTLSKELLAGLYFRKEMNLAYVLASAGLGWNTYETQRAINFVNRQAKSTHGAIVGTVYGEAGLKFQRNRSSVLQPFFGLQYVGNKQDSFTETGAGSLNLVSNATTGNSFRSLLGTRYSIDLARRQRDALSVYASAIWMHEMLDQSYTTFTGQFSNPNGTNFSSTSTFTVRGNNPGRDWAIIGVGTNYNRNNWRLFGGYDVYTNQNQTLHTGNGGVAYSW